jgi:hypothetical protein
MDSLIKCLRKEEISDFLVQSVEENTGVEPTEKSQVRNGGHFVTRKFWTFTSHLEKK